MNGRLAEFARRFGPLALTFLLLGGVWAFLLTYFRPGLITLDTYPAGGDTPSFVHPVEHLRDVLLPYGNPQAWDLGNFGGYAPYQFYFLPPSLLMIALSWGGHLMSLNVAFKLVSVAGTFLLPLATLIALHAMRYRFPIPAIGAVATLIFLFNEGNSMWGGNIPSTLAGEFSFSLGFGLAVIFLGLLYRGVETGRGWRTQAAVLALAGLCHPVTFVNAVTPGLFFLLDRQRFARNLRYLIVVYGTSVLLMGFWLVPLVAKVGYSTSINWTWYFTSWREPLPRILMPVAILAALDVLWICIRPSPANRPGRYLAFGVLITVITFYNATAAGLPEIRFAPFAQFLALLLALDLLARPILVTPASILPALALMGGIVGWVEANTTFIPSWIKWNYDGIERKPTYATLRKITDHLKGSLGDSRIAYENSPQYEKFGSMRIWESLPHFAGRPTLEGLLLQTPVTSPFIYYIQSEISLQGTGVIPGYPYPSVNPQRGTLRLDLFNARDLLAITPTVKDALATDSRWERTLDLPPYAVFTRRGGDPHYVRVPHYRPVIVETRRWKKDFHRWFSTDAALSVPIVAADTVPPAERPLFGLESASPTELPHVPITANCDIDERIENEAIDFTTTCPHLPHWIAVSYYPNWHVEGAARVYLASPAFMLVFPDGPHLEPGEAVTRGLAVAQPWVVGWATVVILAVTGFNLVRAIGPRYFYQRGWSHFEKGEYAAAIPWFQRAITFGGETSQAADGTFFRAASLLRQNKPAEAMAGYRAVITDFPDSIWVAEAHYHVGLCLQQLGRIREAKAEWRYVVVNYPGNRWAGFASDRLREVRTAREARDHRG
jgi:hypothetical protein